MQKWMYVVIGIVAAVAVVGVVLGVRYLGPERPPVENGVPPQNGDVVNGVDDNDVPDVAAATSLRFSMEFTNGEIGDFTWLAKNIGTEEFKLRIEGLLYGFEIGYIVNGELQRAWELRDDEWIDMPSEAWDEVWDGFVTELDVVISELDEGTHGDWTYTDPDEGYLVRIYDIEIDPDLDDALFEP